MNYFSNFILCKQICDQQRTPSRFDVVTSISFPEKFSRRVSTAIESGELFAENRSAFVRECVDFYEPILPHPTKEQFNEISRGLCDKYPTLKDMKKTVYWVRTVIRNLAP